MQDAAGKREENAPGRITAELAVGDLVLLRVTPRVQIQMAGAGPLKFTRSTYPTIYRIVEVVRGQGFAYRIVDHEDPARRLEIEQPVGAGRLGKIDMAELEAR